MQANHGLDHNFAKKKNSIQCDPKSAHRVKFNLLEMLSMPFLYKYKITCNIITFT